MTTGRPRNNAGLSAAREIAPSTAPGFTLMELVLVLAVIALMAGVAAPSLHRFVVSREAVDTAFEVAALSHWARSYAVTQGAPCRLQVALNGKACWLTVWRGGAYRPVEDRAVSRVDLPEGVSVGLETTPADPASPDVQFHPSGRCDVATLAVRGRNGDVCLLSCRTPRERFQVVSPGEAQAP